MSIQGTHLHLIVEAHGRAALTRGMRSFLISAAKQIHHAIRTRTGAKSEGRVFRDRYHETVLTTPRQVRHALAYVLNNWRHHADDKRGIPRTWALDPFSSAVQFDGWKEREGDILVRPWRDGYRPLVVWYAKSWLLTTGWRRHGLIRMREVPKGSSRRAARPIRAG
jgi:hypothetical protein